MTTAYKAPFVITLNDSSLKLIELIFGILSMSLIGKLFLNELFIYYLLKVESMGLQNFCSIIIIVFQDYLTGLFPNFCKCKFRFYNIIKSYTNLYIDNVIFFICYSLIVALKTIVKHCSVTWA